MVTFLDAQNTQADMSSGCSTCWPTQATIWAMLTGEPLEPHWLMMRGLLWRDRLVMHVSPAAVRMLDKMPCAPVMQPTQAGMSHMPDAISFPLQ